MKKIAIAFIRLYQRTLSPDHGWMRLFYPYGCCRFHPTCSQYAIEAIEKHGLGRGSWLALNRILRCHPWAAGGNDPVPAVLTELVLKKENSSHA